MKKTLLTSIIVATIGIVNAQPQTYVPDDNFEQALIDKGYDAVLDDSVTTANIDTVTSLDVRNVISDLTGIEDFSALTYLNCGYNQLTNLDVSFNDALTDLRCGFCGLF